MGKCFFNILATFAEFEVDLLRIRTREGMAIAGARGRLKGKAPKLSRTQRTVLLKLHTATESTRSLSWPNCSPSATPPSTARSRARAPRTPSPAFAERSFLRCRWLSSDSRAEPPMSRPSIGRALRHADGLHALVRRARL
jgi:Resolvase, N terminal domain